MKKRSKSQKLDDCYAAYRAIKEGEPVKHMHAKDFSIPTHPIMNVPELPEKIVLKNCLIWLAKHNIFCNRMNVGAGRLADGLTWATFGVKGAGDIIGLLPNGQHFEIEVKRGKGGRLSLNQQKRKRNIEMNNGIYLIVHGIEELEFYFKDLLK